MARGAPDFGAATPRELTAPALDPGELAARLGSAVRFDRLGFVVQIVDGWGLGGEENTLGGATARIDMVPPVGGLPGYVARMEVGANGHSANVRTTIPYLGDVGAGVEAVWKDGGTGPPDVRLTLNADDGSTLVQAGVRWDETAGQWEYTDSNGSSVATPTQADDPIGDGWNWIKVAVDPATGKYLRGVANGTELGLAGIDANTVASISRSIEGVFGVIGYDAGVRHAYVAQMIHTVNEE